MTKRTRAAGNKGDYVFIYWTADIDALVVAIAEHIQSIERELENRLFPRDIIHLSADYAAARERRDDSRLAELFPGSAPYNIGLLAETALLWLARHAEALSIPDWEALGARYSDMLAAVNENARMIHLSTAAMTAYRRIAAVLAAKEPSIARLRYGDDINRKLVVGLALLFSARWVEEHTDADRN